MSLTRIIEGFLTALTICMAPASFAGDIELNHRNFTIPVVKERGVIIVSRTEIVTQPGTAAHCLKQLVLNLGGSTDIKDISSIKVYCNTDSTYLSEEAALKAPLFNSHTPTFAGNTVTLNGNLRLSGKKNYVWIGVDIKESAIVGNKIKIGISGLVIDDIIVKNGLPQAFAYRIASAVRQSMQDNVHTSRIPGLATALNGDLLAIYDARYDSRRDLQGDIDIALNRSTDKGNSWLPLQKIIDMGTFNGLPEKFNGVSDPCILVDKSNGNIFVAGLWMHGVLDDKGKWTEGLSDTSTDWNHQWKSKGSQPGFDIKQTAQFLLVKSTDNGKTWSKPVNLTKMCKKEEWWLWAPAPGSGFTMNDGTLVFPTQGRDKTGKAFSTITYSKDGGKTWVTGNPAYDLSTTECMAAQLSDGSIMLNMRTNANKDLTGPGNGRAVAVTKDMGKTWAVHTTSRNALPEPVCMGSLYKHVYKAKDGSQKNVLLFFNPNSTSKRNQLTLKVSLDDGNTWPAKQFVLLDEFNGSGYSCITSVDNETIGVIYEGSQAHLTFEKINITEIIQ